MDLNTISDDALLSLIAGDDDDKDADTDGTDYAAIESALTANPDIESFRYESDRLVCTTIPFTATDTNDRKTKTVRSIEVGQLEIHILYNGTVKIKKAPGNPYHYQTVHPNVSSSGVMCTGNMVEIAEFIRMKELAILVASICLFLKACSSYQPYWNPFSLNPCEGCARPYSVNGIHNCELCICLHCDYKGSERCFDCKKIRKCDIQRAKREIVRMLRIQSGGCREYNSTVNTDGISNALTKHFDIRPDESVGIHQLTGLLTDKIIDAGDRMDSVEYAALIMDVIKRED